MISFLLFELIIKILKHKLSIDNLYYLSHNFFSFPESNCVSLLNEIKSSYCLQLCNEGEQDKDNQFLFGLKFFNYVNQFGEIQFSNLIQR